LKIFLSLSVALLLLTSCATTSTPAAPQLGEIDRPPFDRAIWGIHIEDDDGTVIASRNAHTLLVPASNRKLFATATIVDCLGLDAQLHTEIWRDGDDLIVRGDGDPSLGSWRYGREDDFDRVAQLVQQRGITRINDVVADVSLFSDRITIPGSWKSGNLDSDYAAPVDALSWGENEIPVNRAARDAAMHTATALRDALHARGIAVNGIRVETAPRTWSERIATLPSPFVAHLLMAALKNSHNLYTEMLFKRAGGGTYAGGFASERLLADALRIPADSYRFVDASGLSPDDLVTPFALVQLLRWMNGPEQRATWWTLLAQPAGEGTLRRRLVTLERRLVGKTGTIAGVNALSGIIAMPNGRHRYFSVIVNHHTGDGDEAVAIIDAIVTRFSS
jgi:D-alanyl-D-alanine carboxypeptidase/D-alanyl-D-alanine-endopeptidase (penicillin-binding protein 4)